MKIAIYGKEFKETFNEAIYKIFEKLNKNKAEIYVYKPFHTFIKENLFFHPQINGEYISTKNFPDDIDLFFSIGGDGTFLESVSYVKNKNIPIVGINSGRLGFLANISKNEISKAIDEIVANNYQIENRTLLQLTSNQKLFGKNNFALNELTVQKKDTSSMITIHVYMNNEYLNTYWADGLIVATPTGSTAYSLSAGGPIIVPGSGNFVITPIAPHNLTVRPIVLSDNNELKLIVEGRSDKFLAALDYRQESFDANCELIVKKAEFQVKMIKLKNGSFFNTIRNKLMWGVDKRN